MSPSPPVFGKRGITRTRPAAPHMAGEMSLFAAPDAPAAFFAAVRAEPDGDRDDRRMVVPCSFKAAFLAGLVVGCALAGFDVTAASAQPASLAAVAAALGVPLEASPLNLAPVTLLLGLFGGARMAATTMLVVQIVLNRADQSSRAAYAAGGAAISALIAGATFLALGHPPAHGWAVELLAGGACGLLYRVLAGRVPKA